MMSRKGDLHWTEEEKQLDIKELFCGKSFLCVLSLSLWGVFL